MQQLLFSHIQGVEYFWDEMEVVMTRVGARDQCEVIDRQEGTLGELDEWCYVEEGIRQLFSTKWSIYLDLWGATQKDMQVDITKITQKSITYALYNCDDWNQ